ncbi:MAG: restriction endonuclease [Terracidiphilus sp.]
MLPVLQEYAEGKERVSRDVRDKVAKGLRLRAEDIAERLPTSRQSRFINRVAWAHSYLKQSGLLESPRRGHYRITERGRQVLASPPPRIDIPFLERYPEYLELGTRKGTRTDPEIGRASIEGTASPVHDATLTPDEQVREGAARVRDSLAAQLLDRVKQAPPVFFERVVIDLLVAMGYGGSHDDAAQVVGKSGDGGIDGIIKEDRLGLESIYVQAKRWDSTVGRPTVQQFAGALHGNRARKGVVITTSNFSREAIEYARGLQTTIVLIDGAQLADHMIEFGVGVSDVETIKLKRLDEDYFGEE